MEKARSAGKFYLISNLPLFMDLSKEKRGYLANISQILDLQPGEIIYHQGHKRDGLYVVVSGKVLLYHPAKDSDHYEPLAYSEDCDSGKSPKKNVIGEADTRQNSEKNKKSGKKQSPIRSTKSQISGLADNQTNDRQINLTLADGLVVKEILDKSDQQQSKERPLDILRKGDFFGVISLLSGQDHTVSARALSQLRLIRIDSRYLEKLLKNIPEMALYLSRVLPRRIKGELVGNKEVFQSQIISIYNADNLGWVRNYGQQLSVDMRQQSGKKVLLVFADYLSRQQGLDEILIKSQTKDQQSDTLIMTGSDPDSVVNILSQSIGRYHFVVFVLDNQSKEIIKKCILESDLVYVATKSNTISRARLKTLLTINRFLSSRDIKPITAKRSNLDDQRSWSLQILRSAREISHVRVGLALGGGAALGLAQIGLLKIFEKEKVPIDAISGTSIGALIGSLSALGYSARQMEEICRDFDSVFKMLSLIDISFPGQGLLSGQKVRAFLEQLIQGRCFSQANKPLYLIACDIVNREEVILDRGDLVEAIMASIAIPGIFKPVLTSGKTLVDGGIINPMPVSALSQLGINRIIAVNSMPSPIHLRQSAINPDSIVDILMNSVYTMQYKISQYARQEADVYLNPILINAKWFEFFRASEFIKLGEKHGRQIMPKIRELLV